MRYPTAGRSPAPLTSRVLLALGASAALLLSACAAGPGETDDDAQRQGASAQRSGASLSGSDLWVNPASPAANAVDDLLTAGDEKTASRVERLAKEPTASWLGGQYDPRATTEEMTRAAAEKGQVPVLVAYNLPERDCGQYSRGGAGSPAEYLTWTREVVAGIGDRPAVVILEPDAIAHAIVGCDGGEMATARYQLLSQAVDLYAAAPRTSVYVDAGNAGWVPDTDKVASALEASGVRKAAGFSLNVSNFEPIRVSTPYGREVSAALGGDTHFVIDTSRNGAAVPGDDWCNPWGARLGEPPTTEVDDELVDAHLWIKVPGDSDGECKEGAPPAGIWWQALADSLMQ